MAHLLPDFEHFQRLTGDYNRIPVVAPLVGDALTPVSAFARIAAGADHAFLFESVIGGEKIARYSFIGANPAKTFVAHGPNVTWSGASGIAARPAETADDPLATFERHLRTYRVAPLPGMPRLLGGAVGAIGYDTVRYYERLPDKPNDDRNLPEVLLGIYDTSVIFDHVFKTVYVAALADVSNATTASELRQAYDAAGARVAELVARLSEPVSLTPVQMSLPIKPLDRWTSNFQRNDFEQMVERCREYIRAGDIFQVVPSQRLTVETQADPFDMYRALRVINPSPFMFYLKAPEVVLVGASPEIMCRVENGIVTNRPLAGTRRRGGTSEEDRRLRDELLADPKERAEHVMLVDLGRNDLGRVCVPGSIELSDVMQIEYYSHVMHICSNVTGQLAPGKTAFDALRATLPVGTVSGAPKVRAMEIIDEFEPTARGPYGGAVGYIDFEGNMDTCIALRTTVVQPSESGWRAHVQAGAGVVADSRPELEYEETLNKAGSMLAAIAAAEQYFKR